MARRMRRSEGHPAFYGGHDHPYFLPHRRYTVSQNCPKLKHVLRPCVLTESVGLLRFPLHDDNAFLTRLF